MIEVVWAAFIGQSVFVAMWFPLPWWQQWIGRALMVKSGALALMLGVVLADHYLNLPARWFWLAFWVVTLGIWSQVVALAYERRQARAERRDVTGTET